MRLGEAATDEAVPRPVVGSGSVRGRADRVEDVGRARRGRLNRQATITEAALDRAAAWGEHLPGQEGTPPARLRAHWSRTAGEMSMCCPCFPRRCAPEPVPMWTRPGPCRRRASRPCDEEGDLTRRGRLSCATAVVCGGIPEDVDQRRRAITDGGEVPPRLIAGEGPTTPARPAARACAGGGRRASSRAHARARHHQRNDQQPGLIGDNVNRTRPSHPRETIRRYAAHGCWRFPPVHAQTHPHIPALPARVAQAQAR